MHKKGLFIFRRDLRIIDNCTLLSLSKVCKSLIAAFIFTPEQITVANKYRSVRAIRFMLESLEDLSKYINKVGGKLYLFYGDNADVIKHCIDKLNIDAVGYNLDITPYAIKRDAEIAAVCKAASVAVYSESDYYLLPMGAVLNAVGSTYQKFTPYYNVAKKKKINGPNHTTVTFKKLTDVTGHLIDIDKCWKLIEKELAELDKTDIGIKNTTIVGGRITALQTIKAAVKLPYINDTPAINTSRLSPFIKFGCVSIREVYHAFRHVKPFIRQLFWRDFYANVLYTWPNVLHESMKPRYKTIKWSNNSTWFNKWKSGKTGFPIVDAGMRELNATGIMHNRTRLIVAEFLIKILLIDWRKGERYFASRLIDYDPASNNLNWQWCASTAIDSQPYFRIFSPWRQTIAHDYNCHYIKRWIAELQDVPEKDILNWETEYKNYNTYYAPIVDYTEQKNKALKLYR